MRKGQKMIVTHSTKPIFNKLNLSKYRPIISEYWKDYKETLTNPDADERVIDCIKRLMSLEKWESNLFILFLHYKKPSIVAAKLGVKVSSFNTAIFRIKQKLKC